jgi:antitoxin HicB
MRGPHSTEKEEVMSEVLVRIRMEPLEEGGYLATSADLPELLAQGRTVAETMEIAQDVARKLVESYLEHGDLLPDALRAAGGGDTILEAKVPVSVAA